MKTVTNTMYVKITLVLALFLLGLVCVMGVTNKSTTIAYGTSDSKGIEYLTNSIRNGGLTGNRG